MVHLANLVRWEKQLMLKRVIEVLMVCNKFDDDFDNINIVFLGLPGPPGPAGPAGIPGEKGGFGEKGFAGDETYGTSFFFLLIFGNETTIVV